MQALILTGSSRHGISTDQSNGDAVTFLLPDAWPPSFFLSPMPAPRSVVFLRLPENLVREEVDRSGMEIATRNVQLISRSIAMEGDRKVEGGGGRERVSAKYSGTLCVKLTYLRQSPAAVPVFCVGTNGSGRSCRADLLLHGNAKKEDRTFADRGNC